MTYDSDIEPDNLIPEYVSTKGKLLEIERGGERSRSKSGTDTPESDLTAARLQAKLSKIQNDVLFDAFAAEQQWQAKRIILERELAEAKKLAQSQNDESPSNEVAEPTQLNDDVNDEAERIAAEVLAEVDGSDDGIEGLFASLPQSEVDPTTGQSQTIISSADGTKTVVRDFGKWTGISPRRALDEACRAR